MTNIKINPNFYTYADLANKEYDKYQEIYYNSRFERDLFKRKIMEILSIKHKIKWYIYEAMTLQALDKNNPTAKVFRDKAKKERNKLWMR